MTVSNKPLSFTILLLLALTVSSTQAQRNQAAQDCFDTGSQATARECLQQRAARSEAQLKAVEAATLKAVNDWKDTPSNRQRSARELKASIALFRRFREHQCEFEASLAAGGTGGSHRRLLCRIELDEQRMQYLQLQQKELNERD